MKARKLGTRVKKITPLVAGVALAYGVEQAVRASKNARDAQDMQKIDDAFFSKRKAKKLGRMDLWEKYYE